MSRKLPASMAGKTWLPLALIGIVAVVAGILLPQALPGGAATDQSPPGTAPDNLTYTPPAWPEPPNHKDLLLRLVLGTAVVLGLCVCTLGLTKRWLPNKPVAASPNSQLQHIESLSLGGRCWMHLVQVADRPVLVGVDQNGLKAIVPLSESFTALLEAKSEIPGEGSLASAYSSPSEVGQG